MNETPDMQTSFYYDNQLILVDWFNVDSKDNIPNLPWNQVYAIGSFNGVVPLVTNSTSEKAYNLPGGTVEQNESIEQTLCRELIEECNMNVISWEPLGYQVCTDQLGKKTYQFRVYAVLEKIGEFTHDPDGGVIKNTLVPFSTLEDHIQYGKTGEVLMAAARKYFV